jgi:ribonuclease P protein component
MQALRRNGEFHRAYARGKPANCPYFTCYCFRNRLGYTRYGITTSKKIGNAVARNRARRLLKEALRTVGSLQTGWDVVLVAHTRTREVKMHVIRAILRDQLRRLGVLSPSFSGMKTPPVRVPLPKDKP